MSQRRAKAELAGTRTDALTEGDGPLAIIAGGGTLPSALAEAATARGRAVHILGIRGEADEAVARFPHTWLKWGEVGKLFATLEDRRLPRSRDHRRRLAARPRQCQLRPRRHQEPALPAQSRHGRRRSTCCRASSASSRPKAIGCMARATWRRSFWPAREARRQGAVAGRPGRHRDGFSRGRGARAASTSVRPSSSSRAACSRWRPRKGTDAMLDRCAELRTGRIRAPPRTDRRARQGAEARARRTRRPADDRPGDGARTRPPPVLPASPSPPAGC